MGVRTARHEAQRRLKVNHPHRPHAEDYQPTPPGVLDDILCGLPMAIEDYTFVDIGAGKGRVLCLAAAYPFRRIVGVELIPSLVEDCRQNLRTFRAPWTRCHNIDCVQSDAASYTFADEPLVIYLYNPFRPPVLKLLQRNLRASHMRAPRPIWVLYYMPVHRQHLDGDAYFEVVDETRDWVAYRMRAA